LYRKQIRPCGGADIPAASYVRVNTYAWQSKFALMPMAHTSTTHSMLPAGLPASPHGPFIYSFRGESHLLTTVLMLSFHSAVSEIRMVLLFFTSRMPSDSDALRQLPFLSLILRRQGITGAVKGAWLAYTAACPSMRVSTIAWTRPEKKS